MGENARAEIAAPSSSGSLYDRIAGLYNITFKFNGYGRSLENYLRNYLPALSHGSRILDAGCGTGLLTLTLMKVLKIPVRITSLDLSAPSLKTARKAVDGHKSSAQSVNFAQANVLSLPFADSSFDLVVTSGVLEYVPLNNGLGELARVLSPGGYILHLPVRPSPISRMLEVMFRFKAHPPEEVADNINRYFEVIKDYKFPPHHPIGWSKTAVLARKA